MVKSMKLVEMTVTQFSNVLASDVPTPGGGSTAALAGALGATLIFVFHMEEKLEYRNF